MNSRRLSLFLSACLFVFSCATIVCAQTVSFDPVLKFSYPGAYSTQVEAIDDARNMVGAYVVYPNPIMGFERYADGTFSAPIIFPGSVNTYPTAINNNGMIAGWYSTPSSDNHRSFFLTKGVYTDFIYPQADFTEIDGINDSGDFVGRYFLSDGLVHAFASIGGQLAEITVPKAVYIVPGDINNRGDIVGFYQTLNGGTHDFRLESDGRLRYHIDPPGIGGILIGTTDTGESVGNFFEPDGTTSSLYYGVGHTFLKYIYPGLAYNTFTGMNAHGLICGNGIDQGARIGYAYLVRRVVTGQTK